jgi:hypothetical protein
MTTGLLDTLKDAIAALEELDLDPSTPGGAVALRFLLEGQATTGTAGHSASTLAPHSSPAWAAPRVDAPRAGGTAAASGVVESEGEPPELLVASWVGVDPERLLDVLEFPPDGVLLRIPSARLKSSRADRQRLLALLKLAIDRKAYGREEVSTQQINVVCSDYGCLDQNITSNLAAREDLIMRRGKRGAYFYRVTQPGIERARGLLYALLEGDGEIFI